MPLIYSIVLEIGMLICKFNPSFMMSFLDLLSFYQIFHYLLFPACRLYLYLLNLSTYSKN
nr:MAG TPA: hypothetical protein [Bacteriophage sp.]